MWHACRQHTCLLRVLPAHMHGETVTLSSVTNLLQPHKQCAPSSSTHSDVQLHQCATLDCTHISLLTVLLLLSAPLCTCCMTLSTSFRAACMEGYGGPDCATPCGGVGPAASYGPAGRAVGSECVACSVSKTGYSYNWMGQNDAFAPRSVAKLGAASPADCLAEFVQVRDTGLSAVSYFTECARGL